MGGPTMPHDWNSVLAWAVQKHGTAPPDQPSKPIPPIAVGQVWRTFDGRDARISLYKDRFFAVCGGGYWPLNADGSNRWDADLNLVEYLGEGDLDPKAEGVVQSKEIPLSEEAAVSSKAQERTEAPQQAERFTQYLIEECDRLRAMLDEKDNRIDHLSRQLVEESRSSTQNHAKAMGEIGAMHLAMIARQVDSRREQGNHDILSMREMCASNFDALFEELSSIKESYTEAAGDIAAVGGMVASLQERHACQATTHASTQEDALDKGLKLTNRTLTAAQILWKILQFAVAASLFGGAATCAVMFLK